MAEADKTHPVLTPEQRVAQRVFRRYGLAVPVDVEGLARSVADIEHDHLPVNSDAVVITTGLFRRRPLVVLSASAPPTRQRFTLAHELGHLLIPWHMGTFACHVLLGNIRLGDHFYVTTEAESNRFASEILLPTHWLVDIVKSGISAGQILRFAREAANVSTAAASLAICAVLPPGHFFALVDRRGFVSLSRASPGTSVHIPSRGDILDTREYQRRCTAHETVPGAFEEVVHWFRFGPVAPVSPSIDARSSSEILGAIIAANVYNDSQKHFYTQSIAGIVGAVNSSRKPQTVEDLLGVLYETFTGRPDLAALTSHPDFDIFLVKKAHEIVSRNQMRDRSHR